MIAGFASNERPRRVIGIDGSATPKENLGPGGQDRPRHRRADRVARELTDDEIVLDDRYNAGTYGIPDERTLEAFVRWLGSTA
jgi:1-aminocyclopropane-1-carboxylate deaminase